MELKIRFSNSEALFFRKLQKEAGKVKSSNSSFYKIILKKGLDAMSLETNDTVTNHIAKSISLEVGKHTNKVFELLTDMQSISESLLESQGRVMAIHALAGNYDPSKKIIVDKTMVTAAPEVYELLSILRKPKSNLEKLKSK